MTPEQAKLKQREDARRRSRQAPRRASSQAVSSDQSEVTEEAPAVYRVPQINVPEDLQGVARLIQTELAKIEQSQTILLSLWEKVKDQVNTATALEINKTLKVIGNDIFIQHDTATQSGYLGFADPQGANMAYIGYPDVGHDMSWYNGLGNSNVVAYGNIILTPGGGGSGGAVTINQNGFSPPINKNLYGSYGSENGMDYYNQNGVLRWGSGPYQGDWCVHYYDNTGAWAAEPLRCDNGTGQLYSYGYMMARASTVEAQINMSIALTREELKAELYAELFALNPGIVIHQTD